MIWILMLISPRFRRFMKKDRGGLKLNGRSAVLAFTRKEHSSSTPTSHTWAPPWPPPPPSATQNGQPS